MTYVMVDQARVDEIKDDLRRLRESLVEYELTVQALKDERDHVVREFKEWLNRGPLTAMEMAAYSRLNDEKQLLRKVLHDHGGQFCTCPGEGRMQRPNWEHVEECGVRVVYETLKKVPA